jgi:hypothetical protein
MKAEKAITTIINIAEVRWENGFVANGVVRFSNSHSPFGIVSEINWVENKMPHVIGYPINPYSVFQIIVFFHTEDTSSYSMYFNPPRRTKLAKINCVAIKNNQVFGINNKNQIG